MKKRRQGKLREEKWEEVEEGMRLKVMGASDEGEEEIGRKKRLRKAKALV